jgi:beta-glucosidase
MGRHAPGLSSWPAALAASHHLLLSHGWAVPVLRANSPRAQIGIALNLERAMSASSSAEDRDATRRFDGFFNRWFLDPLYRASYPADMMADYIERGHLKPKGAEAVSFVGAGDLRAIATPTDFLGVNYYKRTVVRSSRIREAQNEPRTVLVAPPSEWTDMGWEIFPDGLFHTLARLHLEYGVNRIYITENGASYSDAPDESGRIADDQRVRFLRDHLFAAGRAIELGVPLAGYFVWSLLDNFEWEKGYTKRFGITWVDYATQRRLPKESALWYSRVIQENAVASA